ncbi:MAG: amino acid ABC transporter permease, partial [Burkholderiales bacterium]|nr:amino acid ABC transporter permease [Burkholderiales bacterium]
AVAMPELLRVARDAQSLVYNPSPIVLAAIFYLVLLWPLVRLLSRFEHKKMGGGH